MTAIITTMQQANERLGKIIVVHSPQGGVGCTTIASNLAVGLVRDDTRVLLVDADLHYGDVGVFLNLSNASTLLDLIPNADHLDINFFEKVVVTHESGLRVLLGPLRPGLADEVLEKPDTLSKILTALRSHYDYIIVDTSTNLDPFMWSILDIADKIALVAMPTLSVIKNLRFVLDEFDQMNYPRDKVMLVLNQIPEDQKIRKLLIPTDKIESFLKCPAEAAIPYEAAIAFDAMRRGVPIILSQRDKDKPLAREFLSLADRVRSTLGGAP